MSVISKIRGLKFTETVYNVALHDRVLTDDEILQNYLYAKQTWNIK